MDHRFIKGALSPNAHPSQQVALARIAEEAAEIVKEAMKALRFGPQNRYPDPGPTNAEKIVSEFHDLTSAVIDAFGVEPLLRQNPEDAALNAERRMVNRAGMTLGFETLSYDALLVQADAFLGEDGRRSDTPITALALIHHLALRMREVIASNIAITAIAEPERREVSKADLLALIFDIKRRIEEDDSFDGSLSWRATPSRHFFDIHAAYRIGNSEGQGGWRLIPALSEAKR